VPDPRLDALAAVICGYSLEVSTGDIVRITGPASEAAFMTAVTREVTKAGAHPMLRPVLPSVEEAMLEHAGEEQLLAVTEIDWLEMRTPTKMLSIWADRNTRNLGHVPPERQALADRGRRELFDLFIDRIASGEVRWCGVTLPTQGFAQDAGMSLTEFEDFVFGAGHVADPDPVAFWQRQSARQAEVIERLSTVSELRIVATDTDLTVELTGRQWLNADGHENFPDGEVYTSPLEDRTRGHISFSYDAMFGGRELSGVRLWFEGGRVTRHEAARGAEYLRELLAMDEGAARLGEVAFGMNDEIQTSTRNVGFDEKIGGTCHVALGSAFPEAGGQNRSSLHLDMVCDLRGGGEVYGDGELIARDGRFL
jgi:aminopeptidase